MIKAVSLSLIFLLAPEFIGAQELSILENPYKIDRIDCLPFRGSEPDVAILSDTCYGNIYVKGEYTNGLKHKALAIRGGYFYMLNYQEGQLDGQQIVFSQDSLELLLLHYDAGIEHGWFVVRKVDISTNSLSYIFGFSIDDSIVLNIEYLDDGVPLSHMFSYDKFTYEVYFYRSGMPASYVVQKRGSCIYAASYYETGLIRTENEGKVHYKVGQGDSAIGIHSFERSSLEFLYEGKHTEYDRSGELIVEKIIQ